MLPSGDHATAVATPRVLAPTYTRPMLADRGTPLDVTPDGQQFVLRMETSDNNAVLVPHCQATLGQR